MTKQKFYERKLKQESFLPKKSQAEYHICFIRVLLQGSLQLGTYVHAKI